MEFLKALFLRLIAALCRVTASSTGCLLDQTAETYGAAELHRSHNWKPKLEAIQRISRTAPKDEQVGEHCSSKQLISAQVHLIMTLTS